MTWERWSRPRDQGAVMSGARVSRRMQQKTQGRRFPQNGLEPFRPYQ